MKHRPHEFQGNVTRPRACNVCGLPPEDAAHVPVTPAFDMDGVLARERETVFAGSIFPALDDASAARLTGDVTAKVREGWRSKAERYNYDDPKPGQPIAFEEPAQFKERPVEDNPQA